MKAVKENFWKGKSNLQEKYVVQRSKKIKIEKMSIRLINKGSL